MRLFGWCGRPFSEIRSLDRAAVARSGASIARFRLVSLASPLPARVSLWSVMLAVSLGAGVGVLFGVYPASRAAQLNPIDALRAE